MRTTLLEVYIYQEGGNSGSHSAVTRGAGMFYQACFGAVNGNFFFFFFQMQLIYFH